LLVPGGEVRGTCSANSPFTAKHGKCGTCGRPAGEACPREQDAPEASPPPRA